jgi:hypothetical protein
VLKKTFLSGEPLERPELYQSMMVNPEDNKDNLPEDYISDSLDVLPEKQKARFRDGLWVKAEGVIYDKFDETMIVKEKEQKSLLLFRLWFDNKRLNIFMKI